jgi:hypothetical protein
MVDRRRRLVLVWAVVGAAAVFGFVHLPILVAEEHVDYQGGEFGDPADDGRRLVPVSIWTMDADRIVEGRSALHVAIAAPLWFGVWGLVGFGLVRVPDPAWRPVDQFLAPRRLVVALWVPGVVTALDLAAHVYVGHVPGALSGMTEAQVGLYHLAEGSSVLLLPWSVLTGWVFAPFGVGLHRWALRPGSRFQMPTGDATPHQTYFPEYWTWTDFAWALAVVVVGQYLVAALLAGSMRFLRRRARRRTPEPGAQA